ncbi:conserved hypothetical protein [Mycoplasmopsis pulmonis]|uniref:COF family HAD hydrolase protein n=1 Tax=Mycoplasmopsis pulmonis (strain UAB CTIP) TaxID=272635 RepID=Q98Q25_MYCPU|nr:Cof-type HAD-IIB family hydrolase [Mycoplasmopsis pulmonis]MDZ7293652.1 Cof-type HAD-IIB family hydrolase [Mycoplasmopsis pulmonis]CAC13717.1 conserved hypothetical protein [Mycoplasmopsis pulmonis]
MKKISINDIDSLIFDMDGTLLDKNKSIQPKTKAIIEKLKNEQKKIFIATGRPWYFVKKEINELNITSPVISCNGAMVYDPLSDKVIFKNSIDKVEAKKIFNYLTEQKITFIMYLEDKMTRYKAIEKSPWFDWIDQSLNSREQSQRFEVIDLDWKNLDFNTDDHDIFKFLVIKKETDPKVFLKLQEFLKTFNNIYSLDSQISVNDIMPKGSDKGKGVEFLEKNKYLNTQRTLAFGDELNDISMFKVVKYTVAMKNAKDIVKQNALFETKSHNEEGIYHFLNDISKN